METLLELKNAVKHFPIPAGGFLFRKYIACKAVDDVSFSVKKQASFGIAGESGSGKSTIAKLILKLEKLTSGNILFENKNIRTFNRHDLMWYRSQVQTVFQDAASSLNPRMRIKEIVSEPLEVQRSKILSKKNIQQRTVEVLNKVGLSSIYLNRYPHELSGGQKQRVAIARAIILEPSLILLDEPVSALDVSIRAQVLNLLMDIQEREGLTYIIIAHDLAMLQHVTTHIAIMYLGKIVEMGETKKIFSNPLHPYTRALFEAVPQPDPFREKNISEILGEIGNPINPPPGCRFNPRCVYAQPECKINPPPLEAFEPDHYVACFFIDSTRET